MNILTKRESLVFSVRWILLPYEDLAVAIYVIRDELIFENALELLEKLGVGDQWKTGLR
jgi:hypothetical protein